MKNFARVMQRIMEEREITQLELSTLSGLQQSKISRLLNGNSRVDRDDLSALLSAFPDASDRFQIVLGHIHDEVPQETMSQFEIKRPEGELVMQETYSQNLQSLSEKGESALAYLLSLVHQVPSIEDVFVDLARAFGWDDKVIPHGVKLTPQPYTTYNKKPTTGEKSAEISAGIASKVAAHHKKNSHQ